MTYQYKPKAVVAAKKTKAAKKAKGAAEAKAAAEAEAAEEAKYNADQAELYRSAVADIQHRGLQGFLDWLCSPGRRGLRLCVRDAHGGWEPLESGAVVGEKLFAEYYDIDLEAVERHRRAILDRLAEDATKRSAG